MLWRSLQVLLLLVLMATPSVAGTPADQVDWPKDLGAPYAERVAGIEEALGIEVAYWYATGHTPSFSTFEETLRDDEADRSRLLSHFDDGLLEVAIVRPGNELDRFWVRANRSIEQVSTGHSRSCGPMGCETTPTYREVKIDRVALDDLPVGVRFGPDNWVTVEGPPSAFSEHGEDIAAVWSVARALGIPVHRFDQNDSVGEFYDNLAEDGTMVEGAHHYVPGPPEIEQVLCICSTRRWTLEDRVLGNNMLIGDLAGGRVVRISVLPLTRADWTPAVDREEAVQIMWDHLEQNGFDRFVVRPERVLDEPFTMRQVFLEEHGMTWRFQGHAQGPDASAFVEGFIAASNGEVVRQGIYGTATGGYAESSTTEPPLWAILLVVFVAFLLMKRSPWPFGDPA